MRYLKTFESVDIERNLKSVKKTSNMEDEMIDKIVNWFFENDYTFADGGRFPNPLTKYMVDMFDLDYNQAMNMTTILMYEDMLRD